MTTAQKTCMFIISTILWDMQTDGEFEDEHGHLELINKRKGVEGIAELAYRLAGIAIKNLADDREDYDVCKATVDGYLAGIVK